jgi:two-component system CheB/CheR fusion protein
LEKAAETMEPQTAENLQVRTNGQVQPTNLTIAPLDLNRAAPRFLAVFQEAGGPQEVEPAPRGEGGEEESGDRQRIRQLQKELQSTRESHQTTIEELESSNEELKSTNEELQSTNEELQSTNEELESSKEELQSMNEELTTVNSELRSKVEELAQSQDDMNNLLNSIQVATLFLDDDLNIRRFTQRAAEIINLRGSDVDRPVDDITTRLEEDHLAGDAARVLENLESRERETRSEGGGWYRVRTMPYRTTENKIDGVVITFIDITELKQAREQARAQREFAESIVDTVREPLLVLDQDLQVVSANRSFYVFFQTAPQETEGKMVYQLGDNQWDIPELRRLLEEIIPQKTSFEEYAVEHEFPRIGHRRMLLNARLLEDRPEKGQGRILLAMEEDRGSAGGEDS